MNYWQTRDRDAALNLPPRKGHNRAPQNSGGTFAGQPLSRTHTAMIKTEHLTKQYGALTAVDDVTFQVGPGRGARVPRTERRGQDHHHAHAGGVRHADLRHAPASAATTSRPTPLAAKASLGYLPEGAPGYGEMTVRGFLDFIADLRALEGERRAARLTHVIEHLQLGRGARPDHRDAVEGLPAPRRTRAGHHARSAGADPR